MQTNAPEILATTFVTTFLEGTSAGVGMGTISSRTNTLANQVSWARHSHQRHLTNENPKRSHCCKAVGMFRHHKTAKAVGSCSNSKLLGYLYHAAESTQTCFRIWLPGNTLQKRRDVCRQQVQVSPGVDRTHLRNPSVSFQFERVLLSKCMVFRRTLRDLWPGCRLSLQRSNLKSSKRLSLLGTPC